MDTQLLVQGFELLLLGMGIVFGFLTLLVFMLRAMSILAGKLTPAEATPVAVPTPSHPADDGRLIAVISAAVARYRVSKHI